MATIVPPVARSIPAVTVTAKSAAFSCQVFIGRMTLFLLFYILPSIAFGGLS
jgi:hypothetical protein